MEFNKIAGAVIGTLLLMMIVGKVGDALVKPYHPPKDKPGAESTTATPDTKEPEKPVAELLAAAAGDAKAAESRARNCASCHTFTKGGANGVGPNLYDIVGRKKGSHAGFAYSNGLKNAAGDWTYEDLFKYIAAPQAMIADSKMAYRMPSAEQRAQVLVYLRTLSDSPKPLPTVEKKSETPAPKPDEKKAEPAKPDEKKPEPAKEAEPPKPAEAPKPAEPPKATEPPKPAEPGQPGTPPAEEKKN